jgi:alcohol dehydrogenase (cytochrome c)
MIHPCSRRAFVSFVGASLLGRSLRAAPAEKKTYWADVLAEPPAANWLTYHGDYSGRRFSRLSEINRQNVKRLGARWVFQAVGTDHQECTPLVRDGIMYVTAANLVYALDARTGRKLWQYRANLADGVKPEVNRGVALAESRLFFTTSDCWLVALDATNGSRIWKTQIADHAKEYRLTQAPLVVKDRIIVGMGHGDWGARGYLSCYDQATGSLGWRFWTIPKPGEPFSETWPAGTNAWENGGGATWMTGTYDPESELIYWGTGNPAPDYNGEVRIGDNLFTNCVVALAAATGERRWHFQFTPHDTHDWDAAECPMLIDAVWRGRPRKLLVEANRNGFFYVLDRISGEFLLGRQFALQTWAKGLDNKGRPMVIPGTDPTFAGVKACPTVEGAANWMSHSYIARFGLYYVVTQDGCDIYTSSTAPYVEGKHNYAGTGTANPPGDPSRMILRAIDIQTGDKRWEQPMLGSESSWGGTVATAGDLVFVADAAGHLVAHDAEKGEALWHFNTGHELSASPITYAVGGKQHVAIASGGAFFTFSLPG